MAFTIGKSLFHFGLGYATALPEGWRLKEVPNDWAFAVAPDGQEYFLSVDKAYPKRVVTEPRGALQVGDIYVDQENGVVELTG